ncbi:MAG TPA: hypothetical protein DCP31_26685 [Cyanobacteria bacterium UBA8543]|nr:hypothetical protein [Cyanobacteria bacterium UBA8543]
MPIHRLLATVVGKVPLRTVLIVPFVLQIVGTVGLVGYLSWRNGQQAVNEVASRYRSEISDRTSERISTYLRTPHLINSTNADAIRLGQLDIKNPKTLERHFLKQIKVFNSLSKISFSNSQGGFISAGNDERGSTVALTENFVRGVLHVYSVDHQGNHQKILVNRQNYDARMRPFHQSAVNAGKATWSPIYVYVPSSRGLGIAASYPLYDKAGTLQGVLSSDLSLVAINNFLQSLKIGTQGEAFIIERSGMIVASSTSELPFVSSADGKEKKRLKATEIKNPLIRATAEHLTSTCGNFTNIDSSKKLDFQIEGKRQLAQVTSFNDEFGLDWLIVVVVPESDFMQQINAHTYTTILLCVAALIVAVGIGLFTTRWVTKPILRLNTASKKITQGEWDKTVEIKRSDELGQLAESFNQMAAQLQESFTALRESESRLTQFLEALPVGVVVHDTTGKPTYANQTAKQIIGIDTLPKTQIAQLAEDYQVYLSETEQLYPTEKFPVVKALSGESSTADDMELHRGDRIIPLQVLATPIYDETGQIVYAIVAFVDITERQQTQKILADYNRTLENQIAQRTAALQKSEAMLKAAQRVAHVGSWEFDVITQKITWSEEQFRIFGLDPTQGEPTYEQHMQQIHPDDRELLQHSHAQMIATGKINEFDFRILRPNGEIRYVAGRGETIVNEQGQVIKFFGTTIDITERKLAEATLQESEERFRTSVENMLDCFGIYSAIRDESGKIIDFRIDYVNEAACVANQTSREQQIGKTLCELLPSHRSSGLFDEYVNVVKTGNPLIKENLIYEEAYNQQRLTRAFDIRAAKLGDGFTAAWRDVTDKKRAEDELRQREQEFRALVENAPDVITRLDRNYRFRYVNPRLELETGVPAREWIGKTELEMGIPEAIVNPWHEVLKRIFETGQEEFYESEFPAAEGMKYWLGRMVPEFAEDGAVETVLNISRDITHRKRAEAAQRESEQFLRSIYDGIEAAIFIIDVLEDGRFRYVGINPAYERMSGILSVQVSGNTPEQVLTPEMAQIASGNYRACIEAGATISYEECLLVEGKETCWITVLTPLRDSNERIYRIIGTGFNISDRKQIEKQLQLQAAAMATATDGIAILNPHGEYVYLNAAHIKIFGYDSADELLGKSWQMLYDETELQRLIDEAVSSLLQQGYCRLEATGLRHDGTTFPHEVSVTLLEGGERICIVRDITKRKQAEEALRESQHFIQRVADASPNLWYIYDIIEQRNVYVNQEIATVLGYTPEEIQAMGSALLPTIIHPDDWTKIPARLRQLQSASDDEILELEYRMRDANGEWRTILGREIVFARTSDGRVKQILGAATDITQFKQTQDLLQSIFNESTDAIFLVNPETGLTINCNQTAVELFEATSKDELLNISGTTLQKTPFTQAKVNSILDEIERYGLWCQELEYVTKTGFLFWGNLAAKPIQVAGQKINLVRVTNISDVKQTEEKLQQAAYAADAANRTKSQFLANMSHELRTPLNAILGFSQLINKRPNLTSEDKENLKIIIRSGEHLLTLINQVLDLSKIEAGRTILNETAFDLYRLLDDLENMFQLKANNQKLQLIFDCSDDVPQYVQTDEIKLRQVLINLLSNAIKFTKQGSVFLKVKNATKQQTTNNKQQTTIHFEIEDTGVGIASEELESIFEAFVQAKTGKESQEGTGLGLSISRKFVELMGGQITVSSVVDKGSTFKFDIRVDVVEPEAIKTKQPTHRVMALEPNRERDREALLQVDRILIVDDKPDNRQLLVQLLSPLGFELREASNGVEAIEAWETWQPHLIFMDLRMPVMDGYEATQQIRKSQKSSITKIIALSAGTLEEKRAAALQAGCDDVIYKPFREAEILEAMTKHIGVCFVYHEPAVAPDTTQIGANALNPEDLAALPAEWLASLHQATFEGDLEQMLVLIEQIRDEQLANALASLANNLQYKEILNLTQPRDTE